MNLRFHHFRALGFLATGILASCDPSPIKDFSGLVAADERPQVVKISLPEKVSFNEHVLPILSEQ